MTYTCQKCGQKHGKAIERYCPACKAILKISKNSGKRTPLTNPKKKQPKPPRVKKHKKKKHRRTGPPNPFVRPNYYEYIVSAEWRRKCVKFIAAVGGKCETCEAKYGLQVHHKHYRTLGRETQQDVDVLCGGCHTQEHEPDGVRLCDPISQQFRAILA